MYLHFWCIYGAFAWFKIPEEIKKLSTGIQATEMGGLRVKTSLDKMSVDISINQPGVVVHLYKPSQEGDIGRRIAAQGWSLTKTGGPI
jgi:hypothetical protein